jgi:hypothetical protein
MDNKTRPIVTPAHVENYCARLGARLGDAEKLRFEPVRIGTWESKSGECHANVDYWVAHAPGRDAVRGWIINGTDGAGRCFPIAHSVGRENGKLHDITPPDGEPLAPDALRLFLPHEGTVEEFDELKIDWSGRFYPSLPYWGSQRVEDEPEAEY